MSDEALAEVGRVLLAITIERVTAANYIPRHRTGGDAPMSASDTSTPTTELWPSFSGPSQLAAIERVRLSDRGLPASTYELVRRAAELWPDRPAVSVLPDAERFHTPLVRTFARARWRRAPSRGRAGRAGRGSG